MDEDFSGLCEKVNNFSLNPFLRVTANEVFTAALDAQIEELDIMDHIFVRKPFTLCAYFFSTVETQRFSYFCFRL